MKLEVFQSSRCHGRIRPRDARDDPMSPFRGLASCLPFAADVARVKKTTTSHKVYDKILSIVVCSCNVVPYDHTFVRRFYVLPEAEG